MPYLLISTSNILEHSRQGKLRISKKGQTPHLLKINRGSRPVLIYSSVMIPRKNDKSLAWFVKKLLHEDNEKQFRVIVDPTGMGKTSLVRNLCNKFPKGVIYYEVTEPKVFTKELAQELCMKTNPSNVSDIVLSYFSVSYTLYHGTMQRHFMW